MKTATINYTENFRQVWGPVTIEDAIMSNGNHRIEAGTYDVVQATPECVCLGTWDPETQHWHKAGWLMYKMAINVDGEDTLELWTREEAEADLQQVYADVAAQIAPLVFGDDHEEFIGVIQVEPRAKRVTPRPQIPVSYVGTTHGKWFVDENSMTCHPKSGNPWKILEVVRPGEEWVVTNGNKTGVLTQNRWDNIEK